MAIYQIILSSLLCIGMIVAATTAMAQRKETVLRDGWKFSRGEGLDTIAPSQKDYDDKKWQTVQVPHDWAIAGPFDKDIDKQVVAIEQNGEKEATEKTGRTGSLPWIGEGWYRTTFNVDKESQHVVLNFDGAMAEPVVYVNGKKAGEWRYGYTPFNIDVTPFVNKDGSSNTLAVHLQNVEESSRWYPGAGLYRPVTLIQTGTSHFRDWGMNVETKEWRWAENAATIILSTDIESDYNANCVVRFSTHGQTIDVKPIFPKYTRLYSHGNAIKMNIVDIDSPACANATAELTLKDVKCWSPEHPQLYDLTVSIIADGGKGKVLDTKTVKYGIRTIEVNADGGFMLNGETRKIKGVCLHHDLGMIGSAVNKAALIRQVELLKSMGCDAIRTSHNMPAPELVEACDDMGMMLMAESFDEWNTPKCANGYNLLFNDWAEKDLVNLIRHYRNNPSIMFWCIGNEVPNQGDKEGYKVAKWLQDICHREDPTRPVTQGMDNPDAVVENGFAAVMDVAGFNYRPYRYVRNYNVLPQKLILGSETASTVSSRGVYKFPVERKAMAVYDDHQSSGYDVEHCGWSNLPEDDFIQHEDLPYCMGEFVWTGFDYLGEPTPYYTNWPSHSSLFGIIDLASIPKDRYYLYRSHWNKEEKTLHILPHWTWPDRKGQVTPIFVYTNYPSAELFINGKSQGKRTKELNIPLEGSYTKEAQQSFERQKRYRLMWMDTKYEPGTVKVVAYDEQGNVAATEEIHTAGKPHHIELKADRTHLTADGKDLAFINVRVVDKNGNLCPDETREIRFRVSGAGSYRAAANGNSVCLEPFHLPKMSLFSGQLTAIVQSAEEPGTIVFEALADGLKGAILQVETAK